MSMRTLAASTNAIRNTTFGGITPAYPFTVGGWFCPLVASAEHDIWEVDNIGNTTLYWYAFMASTDNLIKIGSGGGTDLKCVTACVVGTWYYWIGRWISATNRRLNVLGPGFSENAQATTSSSPSGFNGESIGLAAGTSPLYSTAMFAEMWRTNSDIQPDGGVLLTETLTQLAYRGPFSIPSVAESLVWYKSFRQSHIDDFDTSDDPAFARNGRAGWTRQTALPLVGAHPPLASDYVYLNTRSTQILV